VKLDSITITNYRSILNAHKLAVGGLTVLVGPNNEGKSNVLTAANLALDILANWHKRRELLSSRYRGLRYRSRDHVDYDWNRDYPMSLQAENPDGKSTITLELAPSPDEFREFQHTTGINLNTNLRIKLGFGPRDVSYDILMKGRGKRTLNSKREQIAGFIQSKIVYQYVSAIRPANFAKEMIERVLGQELTRLKSDPEYQRAQDRLRELEKPVLDSLANRIYDTMHTFIPAVQHVSITSVEERVRADRRQFNLNIDDGTNTELSLKGDGIISLTTIALVRHFASEIAENQSLILAIEEPESHLHPDAIAQLKEVIHSIAAESQVIITTHAPILVERTHVDRNVVVTGGAATKAKSISQIRDTLGIRLSDNLSNAQLVLLVEGQTDQQVLSSLLPWASKSIGGAIERGQVRIEGTDGAGKLGYYCQFHKQSLSNVYVFFDNDGPGRDEVQAALSKDILLDTEYTLISCPGMANSELEDILAVSSWLPALSGAFGLVAEQEDFVGPQKWTDRVKRVFAAQGKVWNKATERRVKTVVSESAAKLGLGSLSDRNRGVFDLLVSIIEDKVGNMS
jgi:putative ATP-dependent endonuclease of the OLD family